MSNNEKLNSLFPLPSPPPTDLCPKRLPGTHFEFAKTLQEVLKDNHERWHIFFNTDKFHNHIAHRALALYALGASSDLIRGLFQLDGPIQRASFAPPEAITATNFNAHLGDEKFYEAYRSYFIDELAEKGATAALEEYVFSDEHNFNLDTQGGEQHQFLFRFFDGVLHPMIHVGYGLEFGLPGMVAEGLAMMTCHDGDLNSGSLIPSTWFSKHLSESVPAFSTTLLLNKFTDAKAKDQAPKNGVHALDILARMLKDERLAPAAPIEFLTQYSINLAAHGTEISKYAEQWTIDLTQEGEIDRKVEELVWATAVLYGVGGWDKVRGFEADFFLMHLVTSCLFLPSIVPYLSSNSQVKFLRGYFVSALAWWVTRGRPALDLKEFFASTTTSPKPAGAEIPLDTPIPNVSPAHAHRPNPWFSLLQSSMVHQDDHLVKIQRAFAHSEQLYGKCTAGQFGFTELEGAEHLDGSLFIRAAGLTADKMGWAREGEKPQMWGFEGFAFL
ncbi:hypothetical protein BJ138DRAFT_1084821 [Hygrophoropsis aurantiaca]|uniref:Uncharacterized protein n=1 Tax=Hygrophoropsis aurantiaca TaxID=72124 RepID=A0ACB8AEY2_9AGAM|nr:hypothetical protein BJ138DRAFT_1084821 [Hygrophoropsis aurantiaca]